ncbi:MAG TPA: creatininase family protein [Burkholderiaceae bacterium]|nr:creatininase family protein [Burkholderiaceae bacterium]
MNERRRSLLALPIAWALTAVGARAQTASLWLDELTSPELAALIAAGTITVLLPVGGTEQNGAHLALGKHNVRVRVLAGRIAEQLGHAVVAPVMAYVPEGNIDPPTQHMRYAGTLSVPTAAFESVLEGAARSLHQHGFRHVVLLGDHGGYQDSLQRVAEKLNRVFGASSVIALREYYAAAQAFDGVLAARGYTQQEIGRHAGLSDTALAWATDASLVRPQALRPIDGVSGDPRRASAELGRDGVEHIVVTSVAAIRARTAGAPHKP